ncbi:unnamed protein product [Urochloa humidicola]
MSSKLAPPPRAPPRRLPLLPLMLATAATLLTMAAPAAEVTLHPVDYLSLQSIRLSLFDLPGSHFFYSWDFTADHCVFPGISCSSTRVISLALGDPRAGVPGLSGTFPSTPSQSSPPSPSSPDVRGGMAHRPRRRRGGRARRAARDGRGSRTETG